MNKRLRFDTVEEALRIKHATRRGDWLWLLLDSKQWVLTPGPEKPAPGAVLAQDPDISYKKTEVKTL
jgi:hypothetical protein